MRRGRAGPGCQRGGRRGRPLSRVGPAWAGGGVCVRVCGCVSVCVQECRGPGQSAAQRPRLHREPLRARETFTGVPAPGPAEPPSGFALRALPAALTAAHPVPCLPRASPSCCPAFPWDSGVVQSLHPLPETPARFEQPLADVFPCTLLFCRIASI